MWMVEFNILGCRVRRWAEKRRHLLAPDPRSFTPREWECPAQPTSAA